MAEKTERNGAINRNLCLKLLKPLSAVPARLYRARHRARHRPFCSGWTARRRARLRNWIIYFEERVKATAEPVTPTDKRIHTQVVNLLRIEQLRSRSGYSRRRRLERPRAGFLWPARLRIQRTPRRSGGHAHGSLAVTNGRGERNATHFGACGTSISYPKTETVTFSGSVTPPTDAPSCCPASRIISTRRSATEKRRTPSAGVRILGNGKPGV
jgi:hypothetical protein